MDDTKVKKLSEDFESDNKNDYVVGSTNVYIWSDPDYVNTIKKARENYVNVDERKFSAYPDLENTTLVAEPPYCAQNLYRELDSLLQKVLLDENVDIQKMLDDSVAQFQANYLDKISE